MFKVKIYTKLYVFGVKRLFGFHFFLPLLPPGHGSWAPLLRGVPVCMYMPLCVCVCMCVYTLGHRAVPQVYVHFSPAIVSAFCFLAYSSGDAAQLWKFLIPETEEPKEGKKREPVK